MLDLSYDLPIVTLIFLIYPIIMNMITKNQYFKILTVFILTFNLMSYSINIDKKQISI